MVFLGSLGSLFLEQDQVSLDLLIKEGTALLFECKQLLFKLSVLNWLLDEFIAAAID